ncbi:MAG TPA: hypothetical protein VJ890_26830 [Vineibacter sp.]|nr:hypothetical protein [Vineibacter sp.]
MNTAQAVMTATEADVERAVAVIVLAFSRDPMARWSLAGPDQFLRHFPDVVRAFGGHSFVHGTAHSVNAGAGVALWLPPGG